MESLWNYNNVSDSSSDTDGVNEEPEGKEIVKRRNLAPKVQRLPSSENKHGGCQLGPGSTDYAPDVCRSSVPYAENPDFKDECNYDNLNFTSIKRKMARTNRARKKVQTGSVYSESSITFSNYGVVAKDATIGENNDLFKNEIYSYNHKSSVSRLRWSPRKGNMFASGSFDGTISIHTPFSSSVPQSTFTFQGGVKDLRFSRSGTQIVCGGFDQCISNLDAKTNTIINTIPVSCMVCSVNIHPSQENIVLFGDDKGLVKSLDLRSNQLIATYKGAVGEIQDLLFLPDEKTVLCSSSVTHNMAFDKGIIAWDFSTTAIISNQIYLEAYNCTSLLLHPNKKTFLARTSGGYTAMFQTMKPFRMNKYKRFDGLGKNAHKLNSSVSCDGRTVASGSQSGSVIFHDYLSTKKIGHNQIYNSVVADVAFHPSNKNVLATGSWDGIVNLWKQ